MENKQAFILGDYNINTIAAMVSPDNVVNDFHNTFLSYYFHPLITKPTQVIKNKSSLLDNIYSNIAVSGSSAFTVWISRARQRPPTVYILLVFISICVHTLGCLLFSYISFIYYLFFL